MSDWTQRRVDTLRQLWRDGLSCSAIAERLDCSRNAVMGKVDRLNLAARGSPIIRKEQKPERRAGPEARRVAKALEAPPQSTQPWPSTMQALMPNACRWPLEGWGSAVKWCGEPAGHGPYCSEHAAVARGKS